MGPFEQQGVMDGDGEKEASSEQGATTCRGAVKEPHIILTIREACAGEKVRWGWSR